MSDDQGFHEVQLSGKQLVFLFMSAVVVMVVVFLLGVNVGRGVRGAVGDTEVSAQADAPTTKVPDDAVAGGEPAKPAQPELSYHDMLLGAKPSADKAAGDTAPPPVAPPPVEEVPPPTPPTTPTPTPAVQATPTQAPAAPPKSSGTDWFLQTGVYSTQAVADGQVAQLKKLNVPAFVVPEPGGKLFRVRIGPYSNRAEADQVKSRIARQGYPSLITR